MNAAGELKVSAHFTLGALHDVTVDLKRPSVTKLFIGQLPEAVVKTVPYLFTLCAHAQRVAAQAALAAALGEPMRPVRDDELWTEVLHEALWRLLLDWPVTLGKAPAKEDFIAWRQARGGPQFIAQTRRLLDETLPALFENCPEFPVDRKTHVQPPKLAPADWLAWWRGEADALPAPSLPLSIADAITLRRADVARALNALVNGQPFPLAQAGGEGWGIGQTLTARGVLTHCLHVVDGTVNRYAVQAPTDALFADAAPLAGLLAPCHFADAAAARRGLDQAILALDPCLPYVLELNHA